MYKYNPLSPGCLRWLRVSMTMGVVTGCSLLSAVRAQTLNDEVHVTPRVVSQSSRAGNPDPNGPSLTGPGKPIRVDVNLVLVPVTITDPLNRLVLGLEKDSFRLFEGNTPQEIRHFSSEDAPISLGVIFDTSASMRDKFDRAREAIVEFFKTANPQDEFFMISFSDTPSCRILRAR